MLTTLVVWKCVFVVSGGGREDGDFYFWQDAFTVNRRPDQLGKVTKQKQSTRQNLINKNLDTFLFYLTFSWNHVNYSKLFSSFANSSVKLKLFRWICIHLESQAINILLLTLCWILRLIWMVHIPKGTVYVLVWVQKPSRHMKMLLFEIGKGDL